MTMSIAIMGHSGTLMNSSELIPVWLAVCKQETKLLFNPLKIQNIYIPAPET